MAKITSLTAARMLAIEGSSVVDGEIDSLGDLILKTHSGNQINAGRARGSDASVSFSTGILPASYRGCGSSKVLIDGVWTADPIQWAGPYDPSGSRKVRVIQSGSNKQILGQTNDETYDLPLANSWETYADLTGETGFSTQATATLLSSGLVVLSGLLRSRVPPTDNTTIAILPPGLRPGQNLICQVLTQDTLKGITIYTDGRICIRGTWGTTPYLSVDGVAFFSAGSVQWTPIGQNGSSFGAKFKANSDPFWGVPRYYKDPYGIVWFEGLVETVSSVSVENTAIVNLPTTHRAHLEQHLVTVSNDVFASISGSPDEGLRWKTGSPATGWFSLCNTHVVTPEALANNPWYTPGYKNGWKRFQSNFPEAAVFRRQDGLCMSTGLISAGAVGAVAFTMRSELWPSSGRKILAANSIGQTARLDIGSKYEVTANIKPGGIIPSFGNNSWFSLDGLKWVP